MFDTQYFTSNINISYAVNMCIKWKRGLYDLWEMFMITSRRTIVYGAKKLMDNDIFSGNSENYWFVLVNGSVFWC